MIIIAIVTFGRVNRYARSIFTLETLNCLLARGVYLN